MGAGAEKPGRAALTREAGHRSRAYLDPLRSGTDGEATIGSEVGR